MTSIAGLGSMFNIKDENFENFGPKSGGGGMAWPLGGGGGDGGSAQDGLGQIDSGAGTVRNAISTAANALGGSGGPPPGAVYKKGGRVVTTRMKPPIKSNKKHPNW